ncbi:MAG: hypothetical protein OXJ52_06995 [Oligoflexia bacterium]|nr:hypothetical protein [Oligoflexia bacterium]
MIFLFFPHSRFIDDKPANPIGGAKSPIMYFLNASACFKFLKRDLKMRWALTQSD